MDKKPNLKSVSIHIATVALAIAIGIPIGGVLLKQFRTTPTAPTPVAMAENQENLLFKDIKEDLIVFADTKCNYCKDGVQLLDKFGVNYRIYYIDQDAKAKKAFDSLKTEGVPVLISKNQYVTGFSPSVWESFLKAAP